MLLGRKVRMNEDRRGMYKKGEIASVVHVCDDGERVLLDIGYFLYIKELYFIDDDIKDDPLLFSKCIEKHGSLVNALKFSLK